MREDGDGKMNLVLYGDRQPELRETLVRALAAYGGVQYFGGGGLMRDPSGGPAEHYLYCVREPLRIGMENTVVVFDSDRAEDIQYLPGGCPCIVDAGDAAALSYLKSVGHAAVCCGTSAKDTLCVSSMDYGNAVVSVQRELPTLAGTVVEPGDIPLRLKKPCEPFGMLAASAALLLSGLAVTVGFAF